MQAAAGEAAFDLPHVGDVARRALDHSNALGWKLLDLPAQLRISTIDSFCREFWEREVRRVLSWLDPEP